MPYQDFIEQFEKGDRLTAEWCNEVSRAVGVQFGGPYGFASREGIWLRERPILKGRLFKNTGEDTIPAYGLIRITGTTAVGNAVVLAGAKPNIYGSQYMHYVNGHKAIDAGYLGKCFDDDTVRVLYDSADGTPAAGEMWGPRASTYKLKKNTGGWIIEGDVDTTAYTVSVRRMPFIRFHGVTDAAIAKDASGTISIYYGPDAGTDSTVNMSSVYNSYGDVAISKDVECLWDFDIAGAKWRVVAAEC